MQKDKAVNIPLLVMGLVGFAIAYALSEVVLAFLSQLPYTVRAGMFMMFAAALCGGVIMLAETISSGGYVQHWREKFAKDSFKVLLIAIPLAFVIGFVTQFLYGFAGIKVFNTTATSFESSYLICDVSGSMQENDPGYTARDALLQYIDGVNINKGEWLGVSLYSNHTTVLREYAQLIDEDERTALKELVEESMRYDGGTNTQDALLEAIAEMRADPEAKDGMIILMSDGLTQLDFGAIQNAARGESALGTRDIPVNTVFYSNNPLGGYQLSTIAQVTGGVFNYVDTAQSAQGVFNRARAAYSAERLFLLDKAFGAKALSPIRIALQSLFIAIWVFALGVLVVLMLDNKNLIRHFLYPRIVVSFAAGIVFTVVMLYAGYNAVRFVRMIPMFAMLVLVIPTYRLSSRG